MLIDVIFAIVKEREKMIIVNIYLISAFDLWCSWVRNYDC